MNSLVYILTCTLLILLFNTCFITQISSYPLPTQPQHELDKHGPSSSSSSLSSHHIGQQHAQLCKDSNSDKQLEEEKHKSSKQLIIELNNNKKKIKSTTKSETNKQNKQIHHQSLQSENLHQQNNNKFIARRKQHKQPRLFWPFSLSFTKSFTKPQHHVDPIHYVHKDVDSPPRLKFHDDDDDDDEPLFDPPEPIPSHNFDPDEDPEVQKLRLDLYKAVRRSEKWGRVVKHDLSELAAQFFIRGIEFLEFI